MNKENKKMRIRVWLPLLFGLLLSTAVHAQTETLTLSTFYPAPFGVYQSIRLVEQSSAPGCNINSEGKLYVDSGEEVKICQPPIFNSLGGGMWTQTGDFFYPKDTIAFPNLQITIGTFTFASRLDVHGYTQVDRSGTHALTASLSTLVIDGADLNGGVDEYIAQFQIGGIPKVIINEAGHLSTDIINGKEFDSRTPFTGPLYLNRFFSSGGGVPQNVYMVMGGGNVGIGLTIPVLPAVNPPAGKLDVEGSLMLSGAQDTSLINSNLAALYRTGLAPGGTPPYPFDLEGNLVIQPMTTSDADIVFATRNGAGTATTPVVAITKGASGSGMVIDTDYNGSYDAPNEGLIVAGNVGIGTSTPTHNLDVNGSMHLEPSAQPTNANGAIYYESAPTDKFKCYENSVWVDCIQGSVSPQIRSGFVSVSKTTGTVITFNPPFIGSFPEVMITPALSKSPGVQVEWWVDGITLNNATLHVEHSTSGPTSVRWMATNAGNP